MPEPSKPAAPAPHRPMRRQLLGSGLVLCAGAAWPAFAGTLVAGPDAGFYANFNGARLIDQEGRAFKPSRLVGRLVLVNFMFSACSSVCPVQTTALAGLQRQLEPALRPRVHFLSVSLDPLSDTPKALKAYAQRMGADLAHWTFLTGRPGDIEHLSEALRLFRSGPDTRKPDDHNTALWLLGRKGDVRMRFGGNPPDVPRLLRELAALDQLEKKAVKA